jgi:hypothetical protein
MVWTAEESGLDSRQVQGIFLFSVTSILALELTQPPIQWTMELLPSGEAAEA